MDDTDLLEIAETAIFRVSMIAVALGQEKKIHSCGELGAQLFIICRSLDALTSGIEDNVQGILLKLLADVERVCSVTVRSFLLFRTADLEAITVQVQLPFLPSHNCAIIYGGHSHHYASPL
jgi:hypothetical protein